MSIGVKLSETIDSIVFTLFPRCNYYRELGFEIRDHSKDKLEDVACLVEGMDPRAGKFIREQYENYAAWAYIEVLSQMQLINSDICGIEVNEDSLDAGLAVGLVFYATKLADLYADSLKSNYKAMAFLARARMSWFRGDIEPHSNEEEIVLRATRGILHTPYVGEMQNYFGELNKLYRQVLERLEAAELRDDEAHLEASLGVGRCSADLWITVARQFDPRFPGNEDYLITQGRTGQMVDDLKDFSEDIRNKRGYDPSFIPRLAGQFAVEMAGHIGSLDSLQSYWRLGNFFAMATCFHIEEILGRKGRS